MPKSINAASNDIKHTTRMLGTLANYNKGQRTEPGSGVAASSVIWGVGSLREGTLKPGPLN